MAERLLVATKKGLFTVARGRDAQWSIAKVDFLGDHVGIAMRDPRDGWTYAALALGHFGAKLRRSPDDGQTWEECGVPQFPEGAMVPPHPMLGENQGPSPAVLKEIWCLEPGGADRPDLLWAGTIPGAVFHSTDRGTTWTLARDLWDKPERQQQFGGGKDLSGIHSICVDPRNTARVLVGISCGGVWITEDRGATWRMGGRGMRAEYCPPEEAYNPNGQDVHRLAACPAAPDHLWVQHHNGIFRSTDGAASWTELTSAGPSVFGFAVAVHPTDPLTAWFVPAKKDEFRVACDGKVLVTRTRDGGATFDVLSRGLPQEHAYDLCYRHALDVDGSGMRLAFGSTTGGLWVSEDAGDSWQTVGVHFPPIDCVRFA